MIEVSVYAVVKPTERVERVAEAIEKLFPGLTLDTREDRVQGYGGLFSLQAFHTLLREQRILDTARQVMIRDSFNGTVQFKLSKIAAFMGKVNFPVEEEPLGSIHVKITGDERMVDWLAPKTKGGKPIAEIELEVNYD